MTLPAATRRQQLRLGGALTGAAEGLLAQDVQLGHSATGVSGLAQASALSASPVNPPASTYTSKPRSLSR